MDEFTTENGKVVRIGQTWCDTRDSNVRTLRVDCIEALKVCGTPRVDVHLTVIAVDGTAIKRTRQTRMAAERLTSRAFELVTEVAHS